MEFRVLGPLEVLGPHGALNLGGPKQRALLALLLLHLDEVVPVTRLVDELWGTKVPETGTQSVQNYVSRLRKVLGPDALSWRGGGYRLHVDQDQTDLARFERLLARAREAFAAGETASGAADFRRALALWRGPALADVSFEGVAGAEVARLDELRASALEERVEADLALGKHAELVAELEMRVAEYPLRERLRGQLILALYRSGRQAEALQAYQETRRKLLEELGIDPSPTLQRLERAILLQDPALEPTEAAEPARTAPETDSSSESLVEGELRPVTVLFADLVRSRSLSDRLPANEAWILVGECVAQMSRAVEEHGGTVRAFTPDGICAYFGVPAAHEDDPERAAWAALRILDVVGAYGREIRAAWGIGDFDVRIGLNSGHIELGRAGALGDTTRLAGLLQERAAPGTIALGEHTAKRLERRFGVEPCRKEPVQTWRLLEPRTRARDVPPVPAVGRAAEIERLRKVVADLVDGRGQAVFLVGEAGIGKTRLLDELRSFSGGDVTWLQGDCVAYGGLGSSPFVGAFRDWLGAETSEPEIVVRTKLRARLGELLDGRMDEVLPPLARLLHIRLDSVSATETRSPPERDAEEIRQAYAAWLQALAADRPVVLALEDVHWATPATRELADSLLELADRSPLLLVSTLRVDTRSEGWRFRVRALAEYPHRTSELALGPLDEVAAGRLLGLLAPGALDEESQAALIARAEGNPLYLQELLRFLLEAGGLERRRTWTLTVAAASLPPALANLLVARLDLLPPEPRQLAQLAAVIGRTFPVGLLERVRGADVGPDLAVLLRSELVRETRRYPELECTFRHGLLQEAALSMLTGARRGELSLQVAQAYEETLGAGRDDALERLAHYYAQGGDLDKALELRLRTAS
jgi:DNA-binding SARP family transcriptional activator